MRRDSGFTLLEVLIAFVIAALALGVLFRGAVDGLRTSSIAGGYEEAVARARSHLAGIGPNPLPGNSQGDDGQGFAWQMQVIPRAVTGNIALPATLYAVNVIISWQEDGHPRRFLLQTERLGSSIPTPPSTAGALGGR